MPRCRSSVARPLGVSRTTNDTDLGKQLGGRGGPPDAGYRMDDEPAASRR
ncbi:hypothetical protein ACIHAX_13105 [Nocardia sp. NPDC051929]